MIDEPIERTTYNFTMGIGTDLFNEAKKRWKTTLAGTYVDRFIDFNRHFETITLSRKWNER